MREVRTPKDPEGTREDLARAIVMTKEDREWRDIEQTPAYQAWERERNQPIHEPDAEELGWQAEQRFYAEQDPQASGTERICIMGSRVRTSPLTWLRRTCDGGHRRWSLNDKNWPLTRVN